MLIEEVKEGESLGIEEKEEEVVVADGTGSDGIGIWDVKRVVVGFGGRALFYPTLLYNVVRNKIQAEFRWWDWIDEFVLLGAIPFRSDVTRLKKLGVSAVITLNEPHETLVPTSFYEDHEIRHLVLPTRDYMYAPSLSDICRAVDFIYENASSGKSTYVHCKAGRGRSTTIVICYLVKYKQMMPDEAYGYVKAIRPRVLLAAAQWQAVQQFYKRNVLKTSALSHTGIVAFRSPKLFAGPNIFTFDDGSVVVITKADLGGYNQSQESDAVMKEIWADFSFIYRVQVAGEAALARLSSLWLRSRAGKKISCKKWSEESGCAVGAKQADRFSLDIHVY